MMIHQDEEELEKTRVLYRSILNRDASEAAKQAISTASRGSLDKPKKRKLSSPNWSLIFFLVSMILIALPYVILALNL